MRVEGLGFRVKDDGGGGGAGFWYEGVGCIKQLGEAFWFEGLGSGDRIYISTGLT